MHPASVMHPASTTQPSPAAPPLLQRLTLTAILATLLFSSACSTAHKRAQELLDQGLYDDALQAYSELLGEDPKDEDALVGRKKSRDGWIDRHLIEVRLRRQAGDFSAAMDQLHDVVAKEREWGVSPAGKVAFTQGEERDYAVRFAAHETHASLDAHTPLRAAVFFSKYSIVYDSEPDARVDELKQQMNDGGKRSCASFKSEPIGGKPDLARLLKAYCEHWGEEGPSRTLAKTQELAPYSNDALLKPAVTRLRPDQEIFLQDELRKSFEQTAWYDSRASRGLELKVNGQLDQTHTIQPEARTQVYAEEEPYDERTLVTKTRSVPYTDYVDGKPVTNYRQETYSEIETITRYRTVHHSYHYTALKHQQTLSLRLATGYTLAGQPLSLDLNQTSEASGYEHDENHPSIGLSPSRPNLPNPDDWVRAQLSRFAADFKAKSIARWQEAYCQPVSPDPGFADGGQDVAHCLRQPGIKPPGFADQWFKTHFGCSASDGLRMIRYTEEGA